MHCYVVVVDVVIVGTGAASSSGDGGFATSANVNGPAGVWLDTVGNMYISEYSGNKIRKIASLKISTIAGV